MKPARFEYHRPASLAETFDLLDRYGDDGRILAGGQSLVPALNMRLATPRAVIDINRLPGLDDIRLSPEGLVIGALTRQEALERSPLVREHAPLLAAAVPHVGHAAIRARGTVGGSLALADPAAELPACAVALDATIRLSSRRGSRSVAAADFFRGIYTTAVEPGEVVTEIVVPPAPGLARRLRGAGAPPRRLRARRARRAPARRGPDGPRGAPRVLRRRHPAGARAGRRDRPGGPSRRTPRRSPRPGARSRAISTRPATSTPRPRSAGTWPASSSRG